MSPNRTRGSDFYKMISHRPDMESTLNQRSQYKNMLLLNKLKNQSLPFYYVDLDPKKVEKLQKIAEEASNPHDKQAAQEALDNYKDLIRSNKTNKKSTKN